TLLQAVGPPAEYAAADAVYLLRVPSSAHFSKIRDGMVGGVGKTLTLNIPGRNRTLFVDVNCYRARFVVDRLKFYLLQIQDDVGYVLDDPGEGSKLMLRPSH